MKQNTQPEKQSLTPMQKQAVLVCIVCALAVLLTTGITLALIRRGKTPSVPSEEPGSQELVPGEDDISDHYQINETSSALLQETADAGQAYQDETLFIGDSNTVRLYASGLISLQQFCAQTGIGTSAALSEKIVTFKKDNNAYTIAQAVAKMKPRRVVIMLGTNDTGMSVNEFIANYTALVEAIQQSYEYTDIIVNTVPPVPADHSNYPNMDQTKIDDFNMALLELCEQKGLKFLNSAGALKDANGYGRADYYQSGDIHLTSAGLKALLSYVRTHAYESEDRRPDTSNIPARAEYTPDPSSAVAASSSEAASSEEAVQFTAEYRVDKTGGGSLTSGSDTGKSSLAYDITSSAQSVSVTAVPQEGYVFVKWSDGVTQRTRTDSNFKQNLDVTAVFSAASIHISSSGKATVGSHCTFTAKISGKYLDSASIRWYTNGTEVTRAVGQTSVPVLITEEMQGTTFKIQAVVTYNDCTVTSNTLEVTVAGAPAASGSSSSSSSSSSSGSTGSSGASSGSSSGASSGTTSSSTASSGSNSASNGAESSSSHSTASSGSSSSSGSASTSHSSSASSSHSTSESSRASHSSSASSSHSTSESSSASHSSSASSSGSSSHSTSASTSGSSSASGSTEAENDSAEQQASRS